MQASSPTVSSRSSVSEERQILPASTFWWMAGALTLIRILMAAVELPMAFSLVAAVVFIAGPLIGLYAAAAWRWDGKKGAAMLIGGAILHAGGAILARQVGEVGWVPVILDATAQFGALVWTAGLGALVALVIKEKSMILPVAIFLAGFDCFLVFSPVGPTQYLVKNQSEFFEGLAVSVPAAQPTTAPEEPAPPEGPRVQPLAFIGPADLIFSMVFFVVLYRFGMKVRKTALWLIPVLIGYLILVLSGIGGGLLPALVPIGLTVLIVNWRSFTDMNKEERLGTWLAAALAVGLAGYALYQRANYVEPKPLEQPAGPATEEIVPAVPLRDGLPLPPEDSEMRI